MHSAITEYVGLACDKYMFKSDYESQRLGTLVHVWHLHLCSYIQIIHTQCKDILCIWNYLKFNIQDPSHRGTTKRSHVGLGIYSARLRRPNRVRRQKVRWIRWFQFFLYLICVSSLIFVVMFIDILSNYSIHASKKANIISGFGVSILSPIFHEWLLELGASQSCTFFAMKQHALKRCLSSVISFQKSRRSMISDLLVILS